MRGPRQLPIVVALILLVMCSGVARGQADDLMKQQAETGWQFMVTPYLWMVSLKGEAQVGWREYDGNVVPLKVPIDIGFSDIWDNLSFAGALHFEVKKNDWGGIFDVMYVQTKQVQRDVVYPNEGPGTLDVKLGLTVVDILGTYRVQQTDVGSIELLLGARFTDWNPELTFAYGDTTETPDAGGSWTDPLVGVRLHTDITNKWYASARIEIGGFGMGSDFTSGFHLITGYRLTKMIDLNLGYRTVSIDWSSEGAGVDARTLDLTESGFLLGVGFRF
jgi:hypothetical protein